MKIGKVDEWIPHFYTDQIDCYALRISNDVMTSPSENTEFFIEGKYIVINLNKMAKHNDFVIAILPGANVVTFKQYMIDGEIRYLKPLNPQYPILRIDDKTVVCGVMEYYVSG